MVLPVSGEISASMINLELGRSANAFFDINGEEERELAGIPSGPISLADFYGKVGIQPGSASWSSPGSYNWVVPPYNTLVVRLWGPGGMGSNTISIASTNSSFNSTVVAGAGGVSATQYSGGAGGTTSGGTGGSSNGQAGNNGSTVSNGGTIGKGGNAPGPGGGSGGNSTEAIGNQAFSGNPGNAPGGGGSGYTASSTGSCDPKGGCSGGGRWGFGGGGSGAYTTITYTRTLAGSPAIGQNIPIVVGNNPAPNNWQGRGGNGRVVVEWS